MLRFVGTLGTAATGAAVGVGLGLRVGSPYVIGAVTVATVLALGYAIEDHTWPVLAGGLAYAGVGAAVRGGAIEVSMLSLQVAAAFVGVGSTVALLFLGRWRAGNLKRLSSRPVDAGSLRSALASVAQAVTSGRSLVRRVAGVRLASVPIGAAAVLALWVVVVTGSVALGVMISQRALGVDQALTLPVATNRSVSELLASVTLVPYLAALLVPLYVVTDWFALDGITDPPETYTVVARAAGRTPPPPVRSPGGSSPGESADRTDSSPAAESGRRSNASHGPTDASSSTGNADADRSAGADGAEAAATDDAASASSDPRHWPNTEDNPWLDESESAEAGTGEPETPGPDDRETDTPTPEPSGGADETGPPADRLSGDRVTFGEPTTPDAGADGDPDPTVAAEEGGRRARPTDGRESTRGKAAASDRRASEFDTDTVETGDPVAWESPPSSDVAESPATAPDSREAETPDDGTDVRSNGSDDVETSNTPVDSGDSGDSATGTDEHGRAPTATPAREDDPDGDAATGTDVVDGGSGERDPSDAESPDGESADESDHSDGESTDESDAPDGESPSESTDENDDPDGESPSESAAESDAAETTFDQIADRVSRILDGDTDEGPGVGDAALDEVTPVDLGEEDDVDSGPPRPD